MRRAQQAIAPSDITYRTVLYIGEEQVYALVTEIRRENVLVIGAGKERRMDSGPAWKAAALASVCEEALRRAEDMTERTIGTLVVPDEAIVGLPAASLHHVTGRVQMRCPAERKEIGQRELSRLLNRLCRAVEQNAAAATRELASRPSLELLDARLIETRVDGHAVTTPVGFRGSKLEASAAALFAESALVEELRLLMEYLKLTGVPVAVPWAMACSANAHEAIGLILDKHETIVLLLQGEAVIALERCPYGAEQLGRDLAVALDWPKFRVDALQRAYLRGELDEEVAAWLEEGMIYSAKEWLRGLASVLSRLAEQHPLPAYLYFWEMAPGFPLLERALRDWMETWPLDRSPAVKKMQVDDIPAVSERTGSLGDDVADIAAFALAHYAGRLERQPRAVEALFRQIAKPLRL